MNFNINNKQFLAEYPYVFIDFDGVIKDSVEIKSNAFMRLFDPFGQDVAIKVRNHHEENGGMSRYEKLPLYFRWAGKEPSDNLVKEYSKRFSKLVKQNVIDSEWVPGILDFFGKNFDKNTFLLVTSTPQFEIEEILLSLNIRIFFKEVIGAPTKKTDAIQMLLEKYFIAPESSVMIGDSISDYHAAKENGVLFLLRSTDLNKNLQYKCKNHTFIDFINE